MGPEPPTHYPGPFPTALGRCCGLGLDFPFCHHHHNHQYLHGGAVPEGSTGHLRTRLLAFSRGGPEVQGHFGPSDVRSKGLFHRPWPGNLTP